MATRRDKDLPSHPSMSVRQRPRLPEREVTITDVTQHSTEILTDQDFLITTPSDGDFFRYDGTDWVNVTGIDESDINDGSILARLAAAETITGNWSFTGSQYAFGAAWTDFAFTSLGQIQIGDGSSNWGVVGHVGASGSFGIAATQDGTSIASRILLAEDLKLQIGGTTRIDITSGLVHLQNMSNELLRLDDSSATGSPYLTFYQAGTRRAYIRFNDSLVGLRIQSEQGMIELRNPSNHTLQFDTSGDLTNNDGDVIATVP